MRGCIASADPYSRGCRRADAPAHRTLAHAISPRGAPITRPDYRRLEHTQPNFSSTAAVIEGETPCLKPNKLTLNLPWPMLATP